MGGSDRWDIHALARDLFLGKTKPAPEIKRGFVERHGSGETDSEWSLRYFEGGSEGVGGKARQAIGGKTVFLNEARIDAESTAATDGTIAHERGHHENEHRLIRVFWAAVCFTPLALAYIELLWRETHLLQGFGWVIVTIVVFLGMTCWSRQAEYAADQFAVERLGSPEPVLAMLKEMQSNDEDEDDTGRSNGLRDTIDRAFSTHPLPSKRIKRIKRIEDDGTNHRSKPVTVIYEWLN